MSDVSQGPGWWLASDAKWYPPHLHPSVASLPPPPQPYVAAVAPTWGQPPPGGAAWPTQPSYPAYPPGYGPPPGFAPTGGVDSQDPSVRIDQVLHLATTSHNQRSTSRR